MDYSGSGDVTANVQEVRTTSSRRARRQLVNAGCEPRDFPASRPGTSRSSSAARAHSLTRPNAQAAGAIGVIIFNEGQPGRKRRSPARSARPDYDPGDRHVVRRGRGAPQLLGPAR